MSRFAGYSDEFYSNMTLNTEMELPTARDTLLHFFEQLKKRYPVMKNFYSRDRGDYVLEEDKKSGNYRWVSSELKRICSGYVNPPDMASAVEQHMHVLESVPYTLSVSPLDCESLNCMYGFDYNYRGNHHELIQETLGLTPAFEKMLDLDGARLVASEPSIHLALDEDCRTQCRLSIETRTTAYHVMAGEFPEEQLSVYMTVRRYGSLDSGETYQDAMQKLVDHGDKLLDEFVIENILQPLQQAIAIK